MIRRLVLIPTLAFAFGFAVATLKGQGGGLLDGIGNLSAPWLLVAFLPGLQTRSAVKGALLGVAATMLALAGFYLAVVLGGGYAGHGLRAGLGLVLSANRRYFAVGLLSGPLFGAVGSWWRARGIRATPLAAALLAGEPAVILLIGLAHLAGPFGSGWQTDPGVYLAEFCAGAAAAAVAWFWPRRQLA